MTHDLKTLPEFYDRVADGSLTFQIRENDRNFALGDRLCLREWDPNRQLFTENVNRPPITVRITSMIHGGKDEGQWPQLAPGWVVMGVRRVEDRAQ